jgi:hypothetical protein
MQGFNLTPEFLPNRQIVTERLSESFRGGQRTDRWLSQFYPRYDIFDYPAVTGLPGIIWSRPQLGKPRRKRPSVSSVAFLWRNRENFIGHTPAKSDLGGIRWYEVAPKKRKIKYRFAIRNPHWVSAN